MAQNKKDEAPKSTQVEVPTVKKDANPEVKNASTLKTTQAQAEKDLKGRDKFERQTGVSKDDPNFTGVANEAVVDADPGKGKSFSERTSATQPWAEYQERAEQERAKAEK